MSTEEFLNSILQMNLQGTQEAYWRWQLVKATPVTIAPAQQVIPQLYRRVGRLMIYFKGCFENAAKVCKLNPEINYVLGYIEVYGAPMDHAWNSYQGRYFDVTMELFDESKMDRHVQIVQLSGAEGLALFQHSHQGITPLLFDAWRQLGGSNL
jgi:hypothetical protein